MIKNIFPSKIYEIGEQREKFASGGQVKHSLGSVGGYLVGRPHSKGGIKAIVKSTNQPIEMEGGEVVITKPAVDDRSLREFEGEMLTNRQILSRINQSGGGVAFEDGGEVPSEMHLMGKIYKYGGKTMTDREIVKMMAMGGFSELPNSDSINMTLASVGITNNPLADARIVQRVLHDIDVTGYIMYGDAYYNGKRFNGRIWVELPDGRVVDIHANEILGMSVERAFMPEKYEIEYYGTNYDVLPLLSDEVVAYAYGGELIDPKKAKQILRDGTTHGNPLTDKQRRFMYASMNQKMSLGGVVKEYFEEDGDFEGVLPNGFGSLNENLSQKIAVTLENIPSLMQRIPLYILSATTFFEKMRIGVLPLVNNKSGLMTLLSDVYDISLDDLDEEYLQNIVFDKIIVAREVWYILTRKDGFVGDSEYDKFFQSTLIIKTPERDKFLSFIELEDIRVEWNPDAQDRNFTAYIDKDDNIYDYVRLFETFAQLIGEKFREKEAFMDSQALLMKPSVQKKYARWIGKFLFGSKFEEKEPAFKQFLDNLGSSKKMDVEAFSNKVELIEDEIQKLALLKSDVISIIQPELYSKISLEIDNLYDVLDKERYFATTYEVMFDALKRKYQVEMPLFADDRSQIPTSSLVTPFGTPSQLSVDDARVVRTNDFKLWFGNWEMAGRLNNYEGVSKVYNQQTGEPLVVYQGDIGFRTKFGFGGFPVNYFANNYSYARWFADITYENKGQEFGIPPTIYSFFLRMINPIDLREFGYESGLASGWIEIFARILDVEPRLIYPNFASQDDLDQFLNANIPLWAMLRNNINLLTYIKKETFFDGIIMVENNPQDIVNGEENFTDSYMIFENENIKVSNASFFNTILTLKDYAFNDFRFKKGGML
jgi:hypothetical protein